MENKQLSAIIDRFINEFHGQTITHARLAEHLAVILKQYGEEGYVSGYNEGLKQNPANKTFNEGYNFCKTKAAQLAKAWYDPKYPEASGSYAAKGIRKDLKERL